MAAADPARQAIVDFYANAAGVTDFSAEGGKSLFETTQVGGQPDTNVCTACHGTNHTDTGRTRAGKTIEPMAVSANPARFTDLEKVEKWFRRNCDTVLGRQCTAHEKGNVIAYFSSL
ncbi:MAG: DUF1924 domain-containing protein [Alphaproteobacteria bacterium]|nr:DUF1924 domain-containing protein [Alphaproteobacteria bacterium]MBT5860177.1 DUF1924 domain-containing protein [Alphaproteobacteria bacterium]